MANDLPELFRYHPASLVGSLFAGPPAPQAAREDAKPLVDEPTRWARLRGRFAWRRVYRPATSS